MISTHFSCIFELNLKLSLFKTTFCILLMLYLCTKEGRKASPFWNWSRCVISNRKKVGFDWKNYPETIDRFCLCSVNFLTSADLVSLINYIVSLKDRTTLQAGIQCWTAAQFPWLMSYTMYLVNTKYVNQMKFPFHLLSDSASDWLDESCTGIFLFVWVPSDCFISISSSLPTWICKQIKSNLDAWTFSLPE